jgi:hypothetical protein
VILLASWITAMVATDGRVRTFFATSAVGLLCLSCYWYGASEFSAEEIIGSVAVSILGVIIGFDVRRRTETKNETKR